MSEVPEPLEQEASGNRALSGAFRDARHQQHQTAPFVPAATTSPATRTKAIQGVISADRDQSTDSVDKSVDEPRPRNSKDAWNLNFL